jgi:NAD(P)-dependent dehydrogenase (short-subunit alcohol dehydrogenase family)
MTALRGRRLLVVGGAAGIGLATIRQCLDAGNAVCPGAVETDLFRSSFDKALDAEAVRSQIRDRYALRCIADPPEMASCILFLTSAASSCVTGIALAADGGRSFH